MRVQGFGGMLGFGVSTKGLLRGGSSCAAQEEGVWRVDKGLSWSDPDVLSNKPPSPSVFVSRGLHKMHVAPLHSAKLLATICLSSPTK